MILNSQRDLNEATKLMDDQRDFDKTTICWIWASERYHLQIQIDPIDSQMHDNQRDGPVLDIFALYLVFKDCI